MYENEYFKKKGIQNIRFYWINFLQLFYKNIQHYKNHLQE